MEQETAVENKENSTLLERLFTVGAHLGYSRSRRHPSIVPYIFGAKNKVELFDLEKVSDLLNEGLSYAETLGKEEKTVLFVGGKNEARSIIEQAAVSIDMPYVAGRWIGGTLTNFSEIRKRIGRLEELMEKREKGEFESRYTKRERLLLDREITDLNVHFGGLIPLKELPHVMFVIDPRREHTAVMEARTLGIPVVALLNSDCDAGGVDVPLIGNDAAQKSIAFFVAEFIEAYKRGLSQKANDSKGGAEGVSKEAA